MEIIPNNPLAFYVPLAVYIVNTDSRPRGAFAVPIEKMTEDDIRKRIERMLEKQSLRSLAKEWGVSPSTLSGFLCGRRGPGDAILKPLGLVQYVDVYFAVGKPKRHRKRRAIVY